MWYSRVLTKKSGIIDDVSKVKINNVDWTWKGNEHWMMNLMPTIIL